MRNSRQLVPYVNRSCVKYKTLHESFTCVWKKAKKKKIKKLWKLKKAIEMYIFIVCCKSTTFFFLRSVFFIEQLLTFGFGQMFYFLALSVTLFWNNFFSLEFQLYEALHVGEHQVKKERELYTRLEKLNEQLGPFEQVCIRMYNRAVTCPKENVFHRTMRKSVNDVMYMI